jgi:hypothetical protein
MLSIQVITTWLILASYTVKQGAFAIKLLMHLNLVSVVVFVIQLPMP